MTTPPSYLTDHGDAVEEIGTLAHLLARLVHLTNTEGAPQPLAFRDHPEAYAKPGDEFHDQVTDLRGLRF